MPRTQDFRAFEYVGSIGNGVFNQSNGANYTSYLNVGVNSGNGTYTLSGGLLSVSQAIEIGGFGVGVFNQNGGTATTRGLFIGGSNSTAYVLNNGVVNVGGSEVIGYGHIGLFTQNGGSHFVASGGTVTIGYSYGSGTYNLNNGVIALASGVDERIVHFF